MNTDVLMALEGQGLSGDEGLRYTQAFIEECERRLSRFLPDSEVSRLNASAGAWHSVSAEMMELLMLSRTYHQETGGLFDPSVLPDLKRAGYDVSIDQVRARSDLPTRQAPRAARLPFSAIEIDEAHGQVRLPAGMEIDLGGIAKGWIVQEAAQRLELYGIAAAVSAGGDVFFTGMPADGSKWQVEIEDPQDANATAACLGVAEGAVVTSSITKRTWKRNGQEQHHIIDPRTGAPAEPDWVSVTAIAPRADMAEAYAKAFLIGGEEASASLLLQQPALGVIGINAHGRLWASPKAKEYLNGCAQHVKQQQIQQ